MSKLSKLAILVLTVGILSFFQSFGFSVFGVKPDLALVSVIIASFFTAGIGEGFLLVFLAALILKFAPAGGIEMLVFSSIGAGAVLIKKYLPWHYFLSSVLLVVLGTLAFYLSLAANLILSPIFWEELVLNLIAGILIFVILNYLWQNK